MNKEKPKTHIYLKTGEVFIGKILYCMWADKILVLRIEHDNVSYTKTIELKDIKILVCDVKEEKEEEVKA